MQIAVAFAPQFAKSYVLSIEDVGDGENGDGLVVVVVVVVVVAVVVAVVVVVVVVVVVDLKEAGKMVAIGLEVEELSYLKLGMIKQIVNNPSGHPARM